MFQNLKSQTCPELATLVLHTVDFQTEAFHILFFFKKIQNVKCQAIFVIEVNLFLMLILINFILENQIVENQ